MQQSDPRIQQGIRQRIEETRRERHQVLKNYGQQNWGQVAPPQQAYDRLKRKGYDQAAEQLMNVAPAMREAMAEDAAPPDLPREVNEAIVEAIIEADEIIPVRFVHRGSRAAHAVGRVVLQPSRSANGTGFLVSPRLLITNNHVLGSAGAARSNLLQMNYAETEGGAPIAAVEFQFQPEVLFLTSPIEDLDYTLVAIEPVNSAGVPLERFGWLPLISSLGKAAQGQRVNIIHHPDGRPQQVSLRENFLAQTLEKYLHYMTDTMPGSSGSPVFNDEWEVVALHHAAREIDDPAEIDLYREALGRENLRFDGPLLVNEGSRVSRIVADLRSRSIQTESPDGARLVEQLFSLPPMPPDRDPTRTAPVDVAPPLRAAGGGPVVAADGTVSWTLPLTVTVGLGGVAPGRAPLSLLPTSSPTQPLSADERRRLELFNDQINSQKSVMRALAYLQESREGPYLPAAADLDAIVADYYGDIPNRVAANGLDQQQLYDELHMLIRDPTIATSFPERIASLESLGGGLERVRLESDTLYARSRAHLYTWVDLHPDRMLHGVYTDTLIAPEQLMLKDLLTQLDFDDLLPPRFRNNQFLNCEHIVPQSWFNEEGVPRADLHHLAAADGAANNFRSDHAYRDLGGAGTEGPPGRPEYLDAAGREVGDRFEPAKPRSRGLVARATLYFLVAYQGRLDGSRYDAAAIETLKDWARDNGPDEHERHRNQATFEVQGNRNPLIDHPAWVDLIDFTRGIA